MLTCYGTKYSRESWRIPFLIKRVRSSGLSALLYWRCPGLQHRLSCWGHVIGGRGTWGLKQRHLEVELCSPLRTKKRGRIGSCIFIQFWANKKYFQTQPRTFSYYSLVSSSGLSSPLYVPQRKAIRAIRDLFGLFHSYPPPRLHFFPLPPKLSISANRKSHPCIKSCKWHTHRKWKINEFHKIIYG